MLAVAEKRRRTEDVGKGIELVGKTHELQGRYDNAIALRGIEVIHRRDPFERRPMFCMDGRIQARRDTATIRLPGPAIPGIVIPGLVLPDLGYTLFPIQQVLTQTIPREVAHGNLFIDEVMPHERCGAGGIAHTELSDYGSFGHNFLPPGVSTAEQLAVTMAHHAAEQIERKSGQHVKRGEILPITRGDPDRHTEQFIFVDYRRQGLDPSRIEGFPLAFVISGRILGEEATEASIGLAEYIAFGEHGLGKELTSDKPLHIVGLADERSEAASLYDFLMRIRNKSGENAQRIQTSVLVA